MLKDFSDFCNLDIFFPIISVYRVKKMPKIMKDFKNAKFSIFYFIVNLYEHRKYYIAVL